MSLAVADSHALIWWFGDQPKKLGRQARAFFARAEKGTATVYVSVYSLIEVAEAMRHGALGSAQSFTRWTEQLLASPQFAVADLTAAIVVEAESLYLLPERGDRIIAATALHLDCALITRDPAMRRVPGLTTVW